MPAQSISESIKITSNVKNIRKVSTKIVDILQGRGVDKSCIFDVRLSVEEAVLNAMEHGNKNDEKLTVDVAFAIDDEKIEIMIREWH